MKKYIDLGSIIIIVITFILFTLSVFTRGITHDIFLESAVFIISLKLILMMHKNNLNEKIIIKRLNDIEAQIQNK